jgi:hypothetical protein
VTRAACVEVHDDHGYMTRLTPEQAKVAVSRGEASWATADNGTRFLRYRPDAGPRLLPAPDVTATQRRREYLKRTRR